MTKKETWWQSLKFLLFSISAGVIQIVSFTILTELIFTFDKSEYGLNYFISLVLSVVWNFTFNRKYTFKSANNVPIAMLKVFGYYCVFTPLSILWGNALTGAGWNEYLVLAITMVINFVTEFLFSKFVVYRGQENTNKLANKDSNPTENVETTDNTPTNTENK